MRVRYLHSDIDTLERMEILRDLRLGEFDVLVGINLLREGLDLPEVSLVCILDADKEGFLRNERSLYPDYWEGRPKRQRSRDPVRRSRFRQYAGRNRRNAGGGVRCKRAYNTEHNITPMTIRREVDSPLHSLIAGDYVEVGLERPQPSRSTEPLPEDPRVIPNLVKRLRKEMRQAAGKLEFERAAELRDRVRDLEAYMLENGISAETPKKRS